MKIVRILLLCSTTRLNTQAGALKVPAWGQDVKWVSLSEAYKLIPYTEMVAIMKKLNPGKHIVWGGALRITYDKETKKQTGYQVIEDFYQLN